MKKTKITLETAEEVFAKFPKQRNFVDDYYEEGLEGSNWDNTIELKAYWTDCKIIIDSQ